MKHAPPDRLGKPDDITSVVAFLVSLEGSWVNGQTLRVNRGIVLQIWEGYLAFYSRHQVFEL